MKTKGLLTRILTVTLFFGIVIQAQPSKGNFELTPYFKFFSYSWKEFGDDGSQLLSETGPLFSFGAKPRLYFLKKKELFIEADFNFYFGKVDYDGFLQDAQGNRTPYKSKTVYGGIEFLADAGYIILLNKDILVVPIAGFGIEYWNRDIDDGGKFGYDEKYTVFYGKLGGEFDYLLNKNISFFGKISFKMPFSISESIDLASRGQGGPADINLKPGVNPRFRIEAGSNLYNIFAAIFFETWTLSKSGEDKGYLQPESTRKHFGVKLGYTFLFSL